LIVLLFSVLASLETYSLKVNLKRGQLGGEKPSSKHTLIMNTPSYCANTENF
jgi:hypothetical protein